MSFTRAQIVIMGIVGFIILAVILMFMGIIPGLRSNEPEGLIGKLTIWGVHDSRTVIEDTLIAQYRALNPGVEITYREMNAQTYEEDLVNALASGQGPDIFMIKNTWVPKHQSKMSGLNQVQFPLANLQATFPEVVEQDFYTSSTTFALPLHLDTLAMFYNKDLLDNAGIARPPTTWEELEGMIPRLRQLDSTSRIRRAAAAIGGSEKSINNATDLFSLRLLQDGVDLSKADSVASNLAINGDASLRYYTNFANPGSPLYTWSDSLTPSLDAFSREEVAILFGYASQSATIKEKNPFLNFSVAPMLQKADATKDINYADYWGLTVSAVSPNIGLSWDFVGTVALNPEIISTYLAETGRHPALRGLIAEDINTPEVGFFSRQSLTAESWYQVDATAIKTIFSDMIEGVITGRVSTEKAIRSAQEQMEQIIKNRTPND